jgi:hypothetical protein
MFDLERELPDGVRCCFSRFRSCFATASQLCFATMLRNYASPIAALLLLSLLYNVNRCLIWREKLPDGVRCCFSRFRSCFATMLRLSLRSCFSPFSYNGHICLIGERTAGWGALLLLSLFVQRESMFDLERELPDGVRSLLFPGPRPLSAAARSTS